MNPAEFWKQTPRTYLAIIEGRTNAARAEAEGRMSIAWHSEYFGRQKTLKPLKKYLEMGRPQKPQTGADVLAVFREYQARGAPLKIRRLKKSS